jgi:plastocyanin
MRLSVASLVVLLACRIASAETHQVQVISFAFQPRVLTIAPGDTVVWTNAGGAHNVVADDGSFINGAASSAAWSYSRTFPTAGEVPYYCAPHGGPGGIGMSGRIVVTGSTPPPDPEFIVDANIGGTWLNPSTPGQGFLIEVIPTLQSMAIGWFTWSATTAGAHDWLSGLGPIDGDSATISLQRSSGGLFNDPTAVTTAGAGTATLRFTSCTEGTVTFERSDNGTSGSFPIQRLTPAPESCTAPGGGAR